MTQSGLGRQGSCGDDAKRSLFDRLIPAAPDEALERFAEVTLLDHGVPVRVTAIDEIIAVLTRHVLGSGGRRAVIVQLPQGRQQVALLTGIAAQLLCRRAPVWFDGPITVVASDINLTGRLRALGVQGYRRLGLHEGNPLKAHRVRRDGSIQPAHGHEPDDINQSLLYLNTRVGWPSLRGAGPGLMVLDATSITSLDARIAALRWAADHHTTAIAVLARLGDEQIVDLVREHGEEPLVLPLTWADCGEIADELGTRPVADSPLSTAVLLHRHAPAVQLHEIRHDGIDEALADGFEALAATPDGPLPFAVARPASLIRDGARLLAHPDDYRTAAALDPAPQVQSPRVLVRQLDREFYVPPAWRSWRTARWGQLVTAARSLWRYLDDDQPKLAALWALLERLDRSSDEPILIRCPTRAAATALEATLTNERRTDVQVELWDRVKARTSVMRFGQQLPWSRAGMEIVAGSPPPYMFPLLVAGEATEIHVLVYRPEARMLHRAATRWAEHVDRWRDDAARAFGAMPPASTPVPVPELAAETEASAATLSTMTLPDLGLGAVLDRAMAAVDERDTETGQGRAVPVGARTCIPVRLEGGGTWWVPDADGDYPVLAVTAGGHQDTRVGDLSPGDEIVIPAGDGTGTVHSRLVAAVHANADVAALDALLAQFRRAARQVLKTSATRAAAVGRVRQAGAEAPGQIEHWASGRTIAPQAPGDVAAVFAAAGQPCPDLRVLYEVANTLRNLHRMLGQLITAVRSRRGDEAVRRLAELVGDSAEELVDEFTLGRVVSVGDAEDVPVTFAGRIVP